ncbi:hypothetical protein [Sphingobium sp. KCTC 72723]|uniref:hypothetical protein n=1 Tax=Sphingobium sp. KCTC 72723 TaxID=2733867 RepID=UPI00165D935A|nr:hypothetical protein [Sphingobium sp. KCTC 72723]
MKKRQSGAHRRGRAEIHAPYCLLIRRTRYDFRVDVRPDHIDSAAMNLGFDALADARDYAARLAARRGWEVDDRTTPSGAAQ